MAGKNQHHIWQMIQRGFGTKRGRDHHIWVYTKGIGPRQTVTRKHGAEDHFFSLDGDNSADEVLTDFENSVQSHLQEVRSFSDGTGVDSEFIAPVISHIEGRSLFLRDEFSRLGKHTVKKIEEIFDSKEKLNALMLNYLRNNPELIDDKLDQLKVPTELRKMITDYVEVNFQEIVDQQGNV